MKLKTIFKIGVIISIIIMTISISIFGSILGLVVSLCIAILLGYLHMKEESDVNSESLIVFPVPTYGELNIITPEDINQQTIIWR